MSIVEVEADSLAKLVEQVVAIRESLAPDSFLWYRGLSCATHELLPKLMRDGKTEVEVFEREKRLLTRFRQRGMAYWPAGYPQDDWEQLFAMQHHGLPTRLLDWSENLFVAAYFALSGVHAHAHPEECVPIVWCIDPVRWNRAMPGLSEYGEDIRVLTTADEDLDGYAPVTKRRRLKSPVAIYGAHNSTRIIAQRGTFVVWGAEVKSLEAFAEDQETAMLWRISFRGPAARLYNQLQTLGFSETMVFPELTYLATELTRTEGWR